MFEFYFGIIWIVFIAFFTIIFIGGAVYSGMPIYTLILLMLVLSLFWFVGIIILQRGYKKVKANKETDLNGEECYAIVTAIYESGSYLNDNPEYKADFLVYIPSRNEVMLVAETIGFEYNKYQIGDYVSCKYYNEDINVESIMPKDSIPYEVKTEIKKYKDHYKIVLPSDDSIVIDGVEYIRKDSINNDINDRNYSNNNF